MSDVGVMMSDTRRPYWGGRRYPSEDDMALQITGVTKDSQGDITHLCGSGWRDTIEGVIRDIERGTYQYFVQVGSQIADVYVVPATVYVKKHLRTTADTTTRNNLDYLGGC